MKSSNLIGSLTELNSLIGRVRGRVSHSDSPCQIVWNRESDLL